MTIFMIFALSILLVISSNSFWPMWVGVELMNFIFIPWLMESTNKFKGIKVFSFFIIQAISSGVFFMGFMFQSSWISYWMVIFSVILKMGSFPFHSWMLKVVESMEWKKFTFLMTFSKSGIMAVMMMINPNLNSIFFTMGGVMAPIFGLNENSLRKLLTFSSFSHLSWIILAISMSNSASVIYAFTYWMTFITITMIFSKLNVSTLNNLLMMNKNWFMNVLSILIMMGYPPLLGFYPKLMILKILCDQQHFFVALFISMMTVILFYLYLKMIICLFMSYKELNMSFKIFKFNYNLYLWFFLMMFLGFDMFMIFIQ